MTYALDTNAVIAILNGAPARVRERFLNAARTPHVRIVVSPLVLAELWFGVLRSERKTQNAQRLQAFMSGPIDVVPFDPDDAREAGKLRAELTRLGTPIGPYDVLIAAQARRLSAVQVTANRAEFERVHGLRCEDWTRP